MFSEDIVKTLNEEPSTIYFQRISVMVTDLLYLWVLLKIYKEVSMNLVICYLSLNFIILDSSHPIT